VVRKERGAFQAVNEQGDLELQVAGHREEGILAEPECCLGCRMLQHRMTAS